MSKHVNNGSPYARYDICPNCGSLGCLGLRTHPKFSLLMTTFDPHPNQEKVYVHLYEALVTLIKIMGDKASDPERWDERADKWVPLILVMEG